MNGFVAVTDKNWFDFLKQNAPWKEVNFWQPSAGNRFRALDPGELFYFKLKDPHNAIAGFGHFVHASILPAWLAWESFQTANGADDFESMVNQIHKYRRRHNSAAPDRQYNIGCRIVSQPVFLDRENWIPVPDDFAKNIVQGKTYDLATGEGKKLYKNTKQILKSRPVDAGEQPEEVADPTEEEQYGDTYEAKTRLGQGSFRIRVCDAYERACSITREHSLPALDAAHIKPYSESGGHDVTNGLLLRSDIHRLFDLGYVTVTPDYEFRVSGKLREEYRNGESYYPFDDQEIWTPTEENLKPDPDRLAWHREQKFLDN